MSRAVLPFAAALLLAGCGEQAAPVPQQSETTAPDLGVGELELPAQVADFPALSSTDCAEVAEFYLAAIAGDEYERAALAWDDPVVDGARLEAVFGPYGEAEFETTGPSLEGAAGSLYCTVEGTLTDAADSARPASEGAIVLRRANDVPGATPDQLRWTVQSSTFVENLERSNRG